MALPQIPLNGRCAGDDRRSTYGSASTRSDCSGPNRGSQARPWVTIGNSAPVHYRKNPDSRLLLRCGCVEASDCAQRTGVLETYCPGRAEACPDPLERGDRICFLLPGGVLRIWHCPRLHEARQPCRGASCGSETGHGWRRPVSSGSVYLGHLAHAVFRRQFLFARA